MISAIVLVCLSFPVGLWMFIHPVALARFFAGDQARRTNRRARKPGYFAINFARISGFFIMMFAVLLAAETILKITRGGL